MNICYCVLRNYVEASLRNKLALGNLCTEKSHSLVIYNSAARNFSLPKINKNINLKKNCSSESRYLAFKETKMGTQNFQRLVNHF